MTVRCLSFRRGDLVMWVRRCKFIEARLCGIESMYVFNNWSTVQNRSLASWRRINSLD